MYQQRKSWAFNVLQRENKFSFDVTCTIIQYFARNTYSKHSLWPIKFLKFVASQDFRWLESYHQLQHLLPTCHSSSFFTIKNYLVKLLISEINSRKIGQSLTLSSKYMSDERIWKQRRLVLKCDLNNKAFIILRISSPWFHSEWL